MSESNSIFNINGICRACLSDKKDSLQPIDDIQSLYSMCTQLMVNCVFFSTPNSNNESIFR